MRRILVENARRKHRLKHGGGLRRTGLTALDLAQHTTDEQLLAVDEALDRLAAIDPVGAKLVKLRFFVGLPNAEAARLLGLPVTAGAMVAGALAIGLVGVLWQWQRARQERASAEANGYASDMYAAQQALLADDLRKAQELLQHYRPGTGREHLRGFEWRYLAAEARSDIEAIDTSSKSPVSSLALSPDGRTLAVGRRGGTIELWNPATLQRTVTLETLGTYSGYDLTGSVAFSPDGQRLAASGTNALIRLWQLSPPRVVGELRPTNSPVCLSFSPDGQYLAASCWRGDVYIWGLASRQIERYYPKVAVEGEQGAPICLSPLHCASCSPSPMSRNHASCTNAVGWRVCPDGIWASLAAASLRSSS